MFLFRNRVNAQIAERGDAKQRIIAYEGALEANRELRKSLPMAAAAFRELHGAGRQAAIDELLSEGYKAADRRVLAAMQERKKGIKGLLRRVVAGPKANWRVTKRQMREWMNKRKKK